MIIPTFGLNTLHTAHRTPHTPKGVVRVCAVRSRCTGRTSCTCVVSAGCAAEEAGNSEGQMEQRPRVTNAAQVVDVSPSERESNRHSPIGHNAWSA